MLYVHKVKTRALIQKTKLKRFSFSLLLLLFFLLFLSLVRKGALFFYSLKKHMANAWTRKEVREKDYKNNYWFNLWGPVVESRETLREKFSLSQFPLYLKNDGDLSRQTSQTCFF